MFVTPIRQSQNHSSKLKLVVYVNELQRWYYLLALGSIKIRPCQTKGLFHLVSCLQFWPVAHLWHRSDEIYRLVVSKSHMFKYL